MSKEMWERRGQRSNEVCGMEDKGMQIYIPRKAVLTKEAIMVNTLLLPIVRRLPLALLPQPTYMPILGH